MQNVLVRDMMFVRKKDSIWISCQVTGYHVQHFCMISQMNNTWSSSVELENIHSSVVLTGI